MDVADEPMGFSLGDLTWDVERRVFLAETGMASAGSLADIADDLRCWLDRGWRFGSYKDAYVEPDDASDGEPATVDSAEFLLYEDGEREAWQRKTSRSRPREFNEFFRALIRTMAELHNNESVAYAMYKTQRFFTEGELKDRDSRTIGKFRDAELEYRNMTSDRQLAWARRVSRRYPRLDQLIRAD